MAENNDLKQGLQDSYSGVKDAANSAIKAGRAVKKTAGTAKKAAKAGKAAAKGAKKLFAMIPLPIKIYIVSGVVLVVLFGGLLYYMPSLISNSLLHQNDPESASSGVDFTDNKNAEDGYKDMEDKASKCREMIIDQLDQGKAAAYNDLSREAQRNGWKLDTSNYTEPPEQTDNQNMVLIYSGYSVSTKNGLGDDAFKHYQGNDTDQVEGLSAYDELTDMLVKARKTKNSTHPYGNLMYGSDFERDSNGEIRKEVRGKGPAQVTYVFPVVYDMDIEELIEKGILPDGVTLDSIYEKTTSIGKSTIDASTFTSTDSTDSTITGTATIGSTDNILNNVISGTLSPTATIDDSYLAETCTSLGNFKITRYCPCVEENGNNSGLAANGEPLQPGVTIAVDPKVIPLGSAVYIKGIGWRKAQDTGGAIKGHIIDLLVPDHHTAETVTTYNDVYVAKNSAGITFGDDTTGASDGSTEEGRTYRDTLNEMAATLGHILFPNESWVDSIGLGGSSSYGDDGLGYFGAMWYWIEYETGQTNDEAFWYFTKDDGRGGQAYGLQFDLYQGSLQEFMRYCVQQDATTYAMFKPYLAVSPQSLYAHSSGDTMPTIWKAAYTADPEGFKNLQKEYATAHYLDPVVKALEKKGYKIDSRSDVVKGLLLGWSFQWGPATPPMQIPQIEELGGPTGANKLTDTQFLTIVYDWRIKHTGFTPRYTSEKKTALELQKQWDAGGGVLGGGSGAGSLNAAQVQKVVALAKQGRSNGAGMSQCLVWVQQVYINAGVSKTWTNIDCAGHARRAVSKKIPKSYKEIPLGAAVFSNPNVYSRQGRFKGCSDNEMPKGARCSDSGNSSFSDGTTQLWGHIGIYVGNNTIVSWLGSHTGTDTLESWTKTYGNGGYGFLVKK